MTNHDTHHQTARWAGRFGISTSIAVLATSAMAHAGTESTIQLKKDIQVPEEMQAQIDAALGKKTVREAVNGAFGVLVKSFEDDGMTLEQKYFQASGIQLAQSPNVLPATDPSLNVGVCYQNCYGNCHGACHGSRGWR